MGQESEVQTCARKTRRIKLGSKRLSSSKLSRRQYAEPYVSVIIPVWNERRTIKAVIKEALRIHPRSEVIVVDNGSTDGSGRIARKSGAHVVTYNRPLGHDVGRSIGARHAKGQILLFTDGDFVIPAARMRPLVHTVERGADVALNTYLGPTRKRIAHPVVLAKHALNYMLHRPDLKGASMTTVPHAISRKALATIGCEALCVPPKAQAIAIQRGLRVERAHYIDVGSRNPLRRRKGKKRDPLTGLIVGDVVEALNWALNEENKSDPNESPEVVLRGVIEPTS